MNSLNYNKNNNYYIKNSKNIQNKNNNIFEINTLYSKKNNNIDNANYNILYINTQNC